MTRRDSNPDDGALPLDVTPAPRRPAKRQRGAPAKARKVAAAQLPVARVAVDISLPHLDRPFDYLVPESLTAQAFPGVRVRVRFAGKLVDGFVLERVERTTHEGALAFLERVVSPEVVLTSSVLDVAYAVAKRWAGTLADVLRLAVPPRHAQVESAPVETPPTEPLVAAPDRWSGYRGGTALLKSLRSGESPRAVWAALPGGAWPLEIADLVAACLAGGRGCVVVVPDGRDAARVGDALARGLGENRHVVLTADLGPAERYRRFLLLSRGDVRVVVGTRAAAFAPVSNLGLVVIWDDGDDLHAEPRAPYPHAREVVLLRAQLSGAAAVVAGHAVTAEGARLVATKWAAFVAAPRPRVREVAPLVAAADDSAVGSAARLPSLAWEAAHEALRTKRPVLVQVPRRGYLPSLACDECRTLVRCPACAGPLAAGGPAEAPSCRWCGRIAAGWRCRECGSAAFRAVVVGSARTAEEFGRIFPGVPVRTSSSGHVIDRVGDGRSIVVATPGAEPVAAQGYGAALLLDGWALLGRADLRASEEALRRWLNAAALVRPASDGGRVVVVADASLRPVQALIRWDPAGHAERELADRRALGFPPAAVFAELAGEGLAVDEFLGSVRLPDGVIVLGPVPVERTDADNAVRALVRGPRKVAADLSNALHEASGLRSARKLAPVRVRIDPVDIG